MLNFFDTSLEVSESNVDTAVIAFGSVEPKGPHLPVGMDMMLANRFAHDFCTGRAVYLLPVFPFSMGVETRGFRGAVSLQQQTLWHILFDIAAILARHRFKRMVVLDFSNYNWILKPAVREINLNREIIQAVWVNPKQFAREAADEKMLPDFGGGAVETSLAMWIDQGLVGKLPKDFVPEVSREHIDYEGLAAVAPEGYWGRPRSASAEAGERLYRVMLEATREYVDYCLKLFPGGSGLADDKREELWWPGDSIPGVEDGGLDWRCDIAAVASSGVDTAVLSTGATEQHSTCQPLGTDYLIALELSRHLAARIGAYLAPAIPIATSWGHIRFRGTVTFSAMTVRRILEDAVESLYEGGFRKVVIINTHGGNWVVKPTMIELNHRLPGMKIISTGDTLAYRGQAPVEDMHANACEGSFIKAFYPDCFKSANLVDFSPKCSASAFDTVGVDAVTPTGVWGYPSKSDAERGRKRISEHVDEAAAYVKKTFDRLDSSGKPRPR